MTPSSANSHLEELTAQHAPNDCRLAREVELPVEHDLVADGIGGAPDPTEDRTIGVGPASDRHGLLVGHGTLLAAVPLRNGPSGVTDDNLPGEWAYFDRPQQLHGLCLPPGDNSQA